MYSVLSLVLVQDAARSPRMISTVAREDAGRLLAHSVVPSRPVGVADSLSAATRTRSRMAHRGQHGQVGGAVGSRRVCLPPRNRVALSPRSGEPCAGRATCQEGPSPRAGDQDASSSGRLSVHCWSWLVSYQRIRHC